MPKNGFKSNDVVFTPPELAEAFVRHFKPKGFGLDPAMGTGAFFNAMLGKKDWCEIDRGRDFFDYKRRVDYIMTNPPWSKMRDFLNHSYEIADDVYFLATIGNCFTRARLDDMQRAGFAMVELCCCETPKVGVWPSTGLQLGMVHIRRGYEGGIKLTRLERKT